MRHAAKASIASRLDLERAARAPVARDILRVPGLLSLCRIPLAVLFPFVAEHRYQALAVLSVAGATDLLDGWYARRFRQQTRTGAVLDGITDKFFFVTVAGSLVVKGSLSVFELGLLATRDIGELLIGLRVVVGGERIGHWSASAGGKITTILQYAAVAAIVLGFEHHAVFVGAAAIAGIVTASKYRQKVFAPPAPSSRGAAC